MKVEACPHLAATRDRYLFTEIAARVEHYRKRHPEQTLISLGIGDVTLPIGRHVADAMKQAIDNMGDPHTVKGYPPTAGYSFLRQAVAAYYKRRGVTIDKDSIFISDGAKSDLAHLATLFGNTPALIPDPAYPAYADGTAIAGRQIIRLPLSETEGFIPLPDALPNEPLLIYLCSPANPTGTVLSSDILRRWIAFCHTSGSLILFDAAYEGFVGDDLPHSIYEIDGAAACAVEVGSLSKSAGFTGLRCGWTVIPPTVTASGTALKMLWERRQTIGFNGVAYPVQQAAAAALDPQGIAEWQTCVRYYLDNARLLAGALQDRGLPFVGGENAPYLWCRVGGRSWDAFDRWLEQGLIVTPGVGFGKAGEGYLRLSAFGNRTNIERAARRIVSFD